MGPIGPVAPVYPVAPVAPVYPVGPVRPVGPRTGSSKSAVILVCTYSVVATRSELSSKLCVFANIFPDPSRKTIVFALEDTVAVVALFDTLPEVEMVANFVSEIDAFALISTFDKRRDVNTPLLLQTTP